MNAVVQERPDGWVTSTLGDVALLVKDKVDPAVAAESNYLGLEHVEAHTMRIIGSSGFSGDELIRFVAAGSS